MYGPCLFFPRCGEFLLLGEGIQELAEFGAVLGQHSGELHAVAHLRIRSDDPGLNEQRPFELQPEIERAADGKWMRALDVAAAEAEVGRSTPDRSVAAFGVNFDGHAHRESRVTAHLPTFLAKALEVRICRHRGMATLLANE